MSPALASIFSRTRTHLGRPTTIDADKRPPLKVLVSGRPPSHFVKYVDQTLGDRSLSGPPSDIEFTYRDVPTGHEPVDVIHLTDSSAILGDRRVPESEKTSRATLFMQTLDRQGVALVRTVTTESIPATKKSPAEGILDKATTSYIVLNSEVPNPHGREGTVIPHSHLRYRFLGYPRPVTEPGRLLFITPTTLHGAYEASLKVFSYADLPAHSLRIVGKIPSSFASSFARTINSNRARITLRQEAISDAARVGEISQSELVLIAAPETEDSLSTIMLALSLDRPVLVQETPSTRALADEIGHTWVRLYEGRLTAVTLENAIAVLTQSPPNDRPSLGGRDPHTIAMQYAAAYRSAAASR